MRSTTMNATTNATTAKTTTNELSEQELGHSSGGITIIERPGGSSITPYDVAQFLATLYVNIVK